METMTITAGRMNWSAIRDMVKHIKFHGYKIEMIESSGWIERDFEIKAEPRTIRILKNWVDKNFSD